MIEKDYEIINHHNRQHHHYLRQSFLSFLEQEGITYSDHHGRIVFTLSDLSYDYHVESLISAREQRIHLAIHLLTLDPHCALYTLSYLLKSHPQLHINKNRLIFELDIYRGDLQRHRVNQLFCEALERMDYLMPLLLRLNQGIVPKSLQMTIVQTYDQMLSEWTQDEGNDIINEED